MANSKKPINENSCKGCLIKIDITKTFCTTCESIHSEPTKIDFTDIDSNEIQMDLFNN